MYGCLVGVIFIWDQFFSRDGSDSFLVKLFHRSALFWPYLPLCTASFLVMGHGCWGGYRSGGGRIEFG